MSVTEKAVITVEEADKRVESAVLEVLKRAKPFGDATTEPEANEALSSVKSLFKPEMFRSQLSLSGLAGKPMERQIHYGADVKAFIGLSGNCLTPSSEVVPGVLSTGGEYFIGDYLNISSTDRLDVEYTCDTTSDDADLSCTPEGDIKKEINMCIQSKHKKLCTVAGTLTLSRDAVIELQNRGLADAHLIRLSRSVRKSITKNALNTLIDDAGNSVVQGVDGATLPELVGAATTKVAECGEVANILFIHPKAYNAFKYTRSSIGYPFLMDNILGSALKVVEVPYLPADTAILGNSDFAELYVNDRLHFSGEYIHNGVVINSGTVNDNLIRNLITFVAEIYGALIVTKPCAFVKIEGLPGASSCLPVCPDPVPVP